MQRVTSNDQQRRLVAAAVSPGVFETYGGFIGENHVVILEALTNKPALPPTKLARLLSAYTVDRYFRCISGATNVSAFELIYGAKPSAALMSEFIVPIPADERGGDEEADPIRISAHGLDFQLRSAATSTTLSVSLTGAVYIRILPTEDDVKPGGRLEATFPLTREARADIRSKVKDALGKLVTELPGGKTHPEWAAKSYVARKGVYESMGLPFDNRLDRAPAEGDAEAEGSEAERGEGGEDGEVRPAQEVAVGLSTPDGLADEIPAPPKWLRLELTLPSFEFTPVTAEADAKSATDTLNAAIAKQLADWAASSDPEEGGKQWGYPSFGHRHIRHLARR